MPAPKDKYAPIISEYYNMLDLWLTQMPLPTWKSTWFQGKALQASVFQSIIMYPFKVGKITKDYTPNGKPYIHEPLEYSQKKIPLYVNDKTKQIDEKYIQERYAMNFEDWLKKAKTSIQARVGNKRHPRIPEDWIDLISLATPWEKSAQDKTAYLVIPYTELLEWICLQAAEKEKYELAEEFYDIKEVILSSDYFSDLLLALSQDFSGTPKDVREYYISRAAKYLSRLLMICAEHAKKLVEIITQQYTKSILHDSLSMAGDHRSFPEILNAAYTLQRSWMNNNFATADSVMFGQKASKSCPEYIWYLYQQYFVESGGDTPATDNIFFVDTNVEKQFCRLMAEKLAQKHAPSEDKIQSATAYTGNVLEYYFEQINKAAILLYMGIYLHFRDGNTQLFARDEELDISPDKHYILPLDLPHTMKSLRRFSSMYSPCLLCGGSGSGKSTYLKKIVELHNKAPQSFLLAVNIPLRFLVSDSTPQSDSIEPTLETSLIWQKVRQYILQRNSVEGEKILEQAESNLINHKIGVAPILLLLDGYNEILSIQNEMALERLRKDIKWLSSKSNIRIIITYRTEQMISKAEIRRSMNWLLPSESDQEKVFYITYDKAKMMELLKGNWVLTHGVPKRFVDLVENRPMYLLAAKELENLSQATQYVLLDRIYNQRCQAGLDSPLVRDGKKSRWMALYYLILPELAYRMVASGNQILERHELHGEIRKILTGHNTPIDGCEDIGSLYWWNIPDTCAEIDSYPFKGNVNEQEIAWIERALLGSDKIIDKDENGAIGFFHEDIRNYLASKHITQRFRLYVKCSRLQCCYDLPIRWERIPKEMRPLVYEALACAFGVRLKDTEKTDAIQILQELVFLSTDMPARIVFMLPGDWMRLKLASQIQEYEKKDRSEVMSTFAAIVKPLVDTCRPDDDYWSLHEKAREILSWTLCRLSQFERQDGKHPVPEKAFQYTELAVKLASDISATAGEPSQKKIAKHYLAKTLLYQAQYLWTQCPESLWPEADSAFRRGCGLLKECADGDSKNAGVNLSNNLLGLWKYSPAPYLQKKSVFQEEIGDIDYAGAFWYFLRSIAFAPSKSANRAYAAMKCAAMLLEQQVFLPPSLSFATLEEFWVQSCNTPQNIMTSEAAGHGILPLDAQDLRANVQFAGLLLKEAERFATDERSYYKGLYLLYCAKQDKPQNDTFDKAQEEFEGDQRNLLKDKLCLAFIEASGDLIHRKKRKAEAAWNDARNAFCGDIQKEFMEISPQDTGSLDAGHRIHNQVAYNNLLQILSSQIEKMML